MYCVLDLDATAVDVVSPCDCGKHVEIELNQSWHHKLAYVHIRPFIREFIKRHQDAGYKFIVFSANEIGYVTSVSNVLFEGLDPPIGILTEADLVLQMSTKSYVKTLATVSNRLGLPEDQLIAIDDNLFMYPYDKRVINPEPWSCRETDDTEFHHLEIAGGSPLSRLQDAQP